MPESYIITEDISKESLCGLYHGIRRKDGVSVIIKVHNEAKFCVDEKNRLIKMGILIIPRLKERIICAIAEMSWTQQTIKGVEHLFAYESRLNYFVQGKIILSLCLYNISKVSGEIIMNVLRTHPYIINGGVISANPFYEEPNLWLAKMLHSF